MHVVPRTLRLRNIRETSLKHPRNIQTHPRNLDRGVCWGGGRGHQDCMYNSTWNPCGRSLAMRATPGRARLPSRMQNGLFLLLTVLDPCAPNVRRRCVHFHRSLIFAVVVVGSERKQGGLMPSDATRPRKRKASFDLIGGSTLLFRSCQGFLKLHANSYKLGTFNLTRN